MPVLVLLVVSGSALALLHRHRRTSALARRADALRAIGEIVERVRDEPVTACLCVSSLPTEAVEPAVRIVGGSDVRARPASSPPPRKPGPRPRERSMTPAAIAARRARANRRARAELEATAAGGHVPMLLVLPSHDDLEVAAQPAPS